MVIFVIILIHINVLSIKRNNWLENILNLNFNLIFIKNNIFYSCFYSNDIMHGIDVENIID